MRLLFLDDSGKAHPKDPSAFAVYGGISLDAANWAEFHRRVTGLKAALFPSRGNPNDWELKSKDFVHTNAWGRSKNRESCEHLTKTLAACSCSVYVVSAEKARAKRATDDARPTRESGASRVCPLR